MRKKVLATLMAVTLMVSMSMTAFAASSDTTSNSGAVEKVVEKAAAGQVLDADKVTVAVAGADGKVASVSIASVAKSASNAIVSNATSSTNMVAAVTSLMPQAQLSEFFTETVAAVAEMRGAAAVVAPVATVKTAAVASDAFGNKIASAGVVKNVSAQTLVLLMSVNADGTIEYAEGVIDPVTGAVVGIFKGTPATITVLVIA